jgi:hypothetical protein
MTWKRFLGIETVLFSAFYFYEFLLANNIGVRGKGFPAPLINAEDMPKAAGCVLVAILGGCLIWAGRRKSSVSSEDARKPDEQDTRNSGDSPSLGTCKHGAAANTRIRD